MKSWKNSVGKMQQKPFAEAAFFQDLMWQSRDFPNKFCRIFQSIRDFPNRGGPYIHFPTWDLPFRPGYASTQEVSVRNWGTKNAEGSMLGMKMMKALLGWLTYFLRLQTAFWEFWSPKNCKMRTPRSISRKSPFWGSMLVCWGVYWMYPDENYNYSKCF